MAISGRQELLDDLLEAARAEYQLEKVAILMDALAVLAADPAITSLLVDLRARREQLMRKNKTGKR
jgi:hypothetical protein